MYLCGAVRQVEHDILGFQAPVQRAAGASTHGQVQAKDPAPTEIVVEDD